MHVAKPLMCVCLCGRSCMFVLSCVCVRACAHGMQVLKASGTSGFNAYEGKMVDMMEAGIIDPVKVVRIGLQDASSVATMLTTTEAMVVQIPEETTADDGIPRAMGAALYRHPARSRYI